MLSESETTDPVTPASSQVAPAKMDESKRAFAAGTVCDIADGDSFSPGSTKPNVPVLAAFGADRLHQYQMIGSWDIERAVSDHPGALYRSVRKQSGDQKLKSWDDLTFQFGPRSFLYVDDIRIAGYAETQEEAERLVAKFDNAYRRPPKPSGGCFYLIKTGREISIEVVPLGTETILSAADFSLHYGSGSHEWHCSFIDKLRTSNRGLSIFEGTPGTGKTSYLRHLMGELKETHRFYFVPPASMNVLSDSDFIGFWAVQRRRHADNSFVVILEDSDAALMTRGTENREQVSAVLNLSDGMLADFLRLQIICTINCRASDIDQALLRPGRLVCHRVFRRLDYAHAFRLAQILGRRLGEVRDYSLAEVFSGDGQTEVSKSRIGFAG